MNRWLFGVGFFVAFGTGLGAGCAAGGNNSTGTGAGGAGTGGNGSGAGFTTGTGTGGSDIDASQPDGLEMCAKFTAEAKQAPAAMLIALDKSASMSTGNKWSTAQLSVVQAIDKSAFDTMHLGLLAFPTSFEDPPPCICNFLGIPDPPLCKAIVGGVSCGVSGLAQIPLTFAGPDKSNAPQGVRHEMYQYLASEQPQSNADDGSPIYEALVSAYTSLKLANVDKRMAVLITDGGFSCTSVGKTKAPRAAYPDGYGCPDWEQPPEVAKLIDEARLDPSTPINTFIVGVPGSNSKGEKQGNYDTPPYSMRLALSTYAVAGSPDTVDPNCNKTAMFTQGAPDPPAPCHIDLSNGMNFNPNTLADAITTIRGKALGCVYDLPPAPPGQTIDPTLVNVLLTVNGSSSTLPKRSNPADDCKVDGCWDYNAKQQVELIGKACTDVSAATDAKVEIYVGCATIVK